MGYIRENWVDRDVQYPNRYKDQNNNVLTLTRDEGTVNEAGTLFNAAKMNNIEDGIEALDMAYSGLLNFFYPVGTIYETTSTDLDTTTKMGDHFGGTWEVYGAGRVLVAKSADTEFDTIGETGGTKTHTLTGAEIPSHKHTITITTPRVSSGSGYFGAMTYEGYGSDPTHNANGLNTVNYGENQPHNNLQPYIVVYRYRRTA